MKQSTKETGLSAIAVIICGLIGYIVGGIIFFQFIIPLYNHNEKAPQCGYSLNFEKDLSEMIPEQFYETLYVLRSECLFNDKI